MATEDAPLCPDCGQPASQDLAGSGDRWACRNEACAEYGQEVRPDELPPDHEPSPRGA